VNDSTRRKLLGEGAVPHRAIRHPGRAAMRDRLLASGEWVAPPGSGTYQDGRRAFKRDRLERKRKRRLAARAARRKAAA